MSNDKCHISIITESSFDIVDSSPEDKPLQHSAPDAQAASLLYNNICIYVYVRVCVCIYIYICIYIYAYT